MGDKQQGEPEPITKVSMTFPDFYTSVSQSQNARDLLLILARRCLGIFLLVVLNNIVEIVWEGLWQSDRASALYKITGISK